MVDDVNDANRNNDLLDGHAKETGDVGFSIAVSLKRIADALDATVALHKESARDRRHAMDIQLKLSEKAQRDIKRMERKL